MEIRDLLLRKRKHYRGRRLDSLSKRNGTLADVRSAGYRELRRVPAKIAATFNRAKIAHVFQPTGRDYLLVTTDGTIFYVD